MKPKDYIRNLLDGMRESGASWDAAVPIQVELALDDEGQVTAVPSACSVKFSAYVGKPKTDLEK